MNELILQQQAISNGALGAEYTLNGAFIIIGALLGLIGIIVGWTFVSALNALKDEIKNIHKRIDTREGEHDDLVKGHGELSTRVLLMEANVKTSENQAEKTASLILAKLGALQGEPGRHKNNPIFKQ